MIRGTRLKERRSRRAVAALSAALLIVVGLLGARHEAEVAHVRDQKGALVHGQEVEEHRDHDVAAHLHGRDDHRHAAGDCSLLAVLHAPAVISPPITVAQVPRIGCDLGTPPSAAAHVEIAGYRLAPKTSPPALS